MIKATLGILALLSFAQVNVAHALIVQKYRLVSGSRTVGKFENGAMFTVNTDSEGYSELVFEKGGQKTLLAKGKFQRVPDSDSTISKYQKNHTPDPNDQVAFFETSENIYVLTAEGAYRGLFEDFNRIGSSHLTVNGKIDVAGSVYAMVSAKYKDHLLSHSGQTGETLVVRISDGNVGLFSRVYYSSFDALRVTGNSTISVQGIHYKVTDFERELKERRSKYPYIGPATVPAFGSTVPNSKDSTYVFDNGTKLHFKRVGEVGVYLEVQDGELKQITSEIAQFFPYQYSISGHSYTPYADQKLVSFVTDSAFWIINQQGKIIKLPANYDRMIKGSAGYRYEELVVGRKGTQYLIVNFDYVVNAGSASSTSNVVGLEPLAYSGKSSASKRKAERAAEKNEEAEDSLPVATGETYVVREDGSFVRVDYVKHSLEKQVSASDIQDGIISFENGVRAIDLDAFDAESRFSAQPTAMDGVKALEQVKKLLRNETEAAKSKDLGHNPASPQLVSRIRQSFYRQGSQSTVLLGDAGSSATDEALGFIGLAAQGKLEGFPRTWSFFRLDTAMTAGTGISGAFESRVSALVSASLTAPIVFYAENIETLRGGGTHSGNSNDFFQMAKGPISRGELRILATGNPASYDQAIKGDAELDQALTRIMIPEATKEKSIARGRAWLEQHGVSHVTDDFLDYAYQVSSRRSATAVQPGKLIALLDEVVAKVRSEGALRPLTKSDIESLLVQEGEDPAHFNAEERVKSLARYWEVMPQYIVGQRFALEQGYEALVQNSTGMGDDTKAAFFALLVGPEGTGKTEYAQALAATLKVRYERFDINNEPNAEELLRKVAQAIRRDPRSVLLFDEVDKAPVSIQSALLSMGDSGEFKVKEALGSSVNSGTRTVTVRVNQARIVLTSNAGAEFVAKTLLGSGVTKRKASIGFQSQSETSHEVRSEEITKNLSALRKVLSTLKTELKRSGLSRYLVDRATVLPMAPATREEFREVLKLHLWKAIKEKEAKHRFKVSVANEVDFLDTMVRENYVPLMSNRDALDIIRLSVRSALAKAKLQGIAEAGHELVLEYKDGWMHAYPACEKNLLKAKK